MAVSSTQKYGFKSGFTNKKAPFPHPKTYEQVQKNLIFFREQAGYAQHQVEKALKLPKGSLSLWEHDVPSKGFKAPDFKRLAAIAEYLKCNADLIDIALVFYPEANQKYKPIWTRGEALHCIDMPETVQDTINNVNYFLALSGIELKDLAKRIHCTVGSLTRWRTDTPLKEVTAIALAKALKCPKELIYFPRIELPKDGRLLNRHSDKKLTLIRPVKSIKDAKNNLEYHVTKARLSARDVARMLGLPDNEAGYQTYRNWKSQRKSAAGSYMDKSQAIALAHRLNIPVYDIMPVYEQDSDVSKLDANITSLVKLTINNDIFEKKVQAFVSGGAILELEPSQNAETIGDILSLPHDLSNIAAATVVGDSMFDYETGSGIADGTCILIDMSHRDFREEIGNVVCFQVNGNELMVKRLKMVDGTLCFWSDNPCYIPQYHRMPKDATLLGVVISCFNKVH